MNLYYDKVNLELSVNEADSVRNDLINFFNDKGLTEDDINKYSSLHKLCAKTFGVWSGWNSVTSHVTGPRK